MDRIKIRYHQEPNYNQSSLEISTEIHERLLARLSFLYGQQEAEKHIGELERILKVHYAYKPQELIEIEQKLQVENRFNQQDLILIAYGDIIRSESRSPLATLANFLETNPNIKNLINTVHILPFFPYSSDRGFSITDFETVDPSLGSWKDIDHLGDHYQLMFDAVFNHVSAKSMAFQELLNGNPNYTKVFTIYQSPEELTSEQREILVRPRTSDVLTEFQTIDGPIWVWTTFSPDQIDLNYQNPSVLIGVIETFLLYIRHGANIVRLDAVTYLWDEPGTSGANLDQTHEIIKLFRDVAEIVAPTVAVITETNIPHQDNIAYFGDGTDEAHMVYNFALPPLVLYTFYKQEATALSQWAKTLEYPSPTTTFFNMLDTHDGVGLMGVKNILSPEEITFIIQNAREHGAFVSYRTGEDGQEEPYEINTTWFSALNLDHSHETVMFQVKRFVASRSIALVLRGVPGIYFHGLIGASNDVETVLKTKSKRDINRQIIQEKDLLEDLNDPKSRLSELNRQLGRLLEIRVRQKAFHPNGEQRILSLTPEIFAVLRVSPGCEEHILTLTNVTPKVCQVEIPLVELGVAGVYDVNQVAMAESAPSGTENKLNLICAMPEETYWYDLVGKRGWKVDNNQLVLTLQPYDVVWLIPFIELEYLIEA